MTTQNYTRREFIGTVTAGLAMGAVFRNFQEESSNGIPLRPLGSTGEKVSIISLGGFNVVNDNTDKESMALMEEALDNGITFWDNCWEYHNGRAEEVMGKVLADPLKRERVFLMTKVCGRDYETASQHLDDSLRRLRTDVIDLWQFHGIRWEDDPDLIFAEEGAVKCALEAQAAGKIRYIGFTGHQNPRMHLRMLEQDFKWATVQMPLNVLDAHYLSFQENVLPVLIERNIGVLGMKSLGGNSAPIAGNLDLPVELLRRYALSLPVSSLVAGIQTREELHQIIDTARKFSPLEEEEVRELLALSYEAARDGEIERYKRPTSGCNWYHRNIMGLE